MQLENKPTEPGIYVVWGRVGTFLIDVDEQGVVYQCKPTAPFERDGVLDDDGWNVRNLNLIGPFKRVE